MATNLGVYDFSTLSAPNVQFFGVTSTTAVTQVFIQSKGGPFVPDGGVNTVIAPSTWVEADNFSFGSASVGASPTPEPSSLILISGALAALWMRRRSRNFRAGV